MSASEKYQAEKRQHNLKLDCDDKDWLRDSQRLVPMMYEHSKKLHAAIPLLKNTVIKTPKVKMSHLEVFYGL